MIKRLIDSFGPTLYLQIWKDRIRVTNASTGAVFDETPSMEIVTKNGGQKAVRAMGNAVGAVTEPEGEVVNPFAHPRTILWDFVAGEKFVSEAFKRVCGYTLIRPAPAVVIHVMEPLEGGLTQIEMRALRELAFGAGARDVVFHEGEVLKREQVDFNHLVAAGRSEEMEQRKVLPRLISALALIAGGVGVILYLRFGV